MPHEEHEHRVMHLRVDAIHLHVHNAANADILAALTKLFNQGTNMSAELDRLTTEVAETKAGVASAITLIQGLAQQIRDNANDPAALKALADDLDASQTDLANAVTAAGTNPAPTP